MAFNSNAVPTFDSPQDSVSEQDLTNTSLNNDTEPIITYDIKENNNEMITTVVDGDQNNVTEEVHEHFPTNRFWKMLFDISWNVSVAGATSFRGGVSNLMARFCDKVNWLSYEEFMEVYVMSNVIPGPKPSQVAMGIG